MSQPPRYTPTHSFVSDSATLANFPGQALDVEFQNVKATTDGIETNLALIQRDDGALANGSVGYDQLSPSLQTNGLAPANAWLTGTAYALGVSVMTGGVLYRCILAHTAGVFATDLAAGKWIFVTAVPVPPPSPTTLGGVQSLAAVGSKWINGISTSGVPSATQPAFADISGTIASSQITALPSAVFANPSTLIGMTANNGVATTSGRSDATPAINPAIAPTWSGQHAWSGGGIFLGSSGSPPFSVGSGTNPYFGSASNSWQLINTLAGSATVPETGFQSILNSSIGSVNPSTAFKIALFAAGTFNSGSAAGYGANVVATSTTGFNKLLTGLEVDLNQGSGLAQGTPGAANASYNIVLSGNPSASFPATAALWITGSSVWTNGIYVSNGVVGNTITDVSSSGISYVIGGSHSYGIDTTQGTFAGPTLRLGNNQIVGWRNAANSADLTGVTVNASNNLVLGGTGVGPVKFGASGMFSASGGVTTVAFGTANAAAGIGTPGSVNKWLQILDEAGNTCWIPVWR